MIIIILSPKFCWVRSISFSIPFFFFSIKPNHIVCTHDLYRLESPAFQLINVGDN